MGFDAAMHFPESGHSHLPRMAFFRQPMLKHRDNSAAR
jgi:hypothetical protein